MEDKIVKTSNIEVKVGLNENNLPISMKWTAPDGSITDAPAKAMLLSIWDPKENNTMNGRKNQRMNETNKIFDEQRNICEHVTTLERDT